ncbi:MAG: metal-dependent hydrolase [Dehalococcoidia bacterium]
MSTPIGHTLFGLTLARRLGVRSPAGMAIAAVAASFPDVDVPLGMLLHGDPWKHHRKDTHTMGFALTAGMLAGFAGIVRAGSAEGERDLIADAATGAALVGSHVVLDYMPFPYVVMKRGLLGKQIGRIAVVNWLIDLVVYGGLAWALWPRRPAPEA